MRFRPRRFFQPASHLFHASGRIRMMRGGPLGWILAFLLSGCGVEEPDNVPIYVDQGMWITDTALVLDEFPFQSGACAEVYPGGSVNVDSVPLSSVAHLRIRATACYRVRVRVIDTGDDTVRTFDTRFGIFNRSESDKNRGVVGFLAWDGLDDEGAPSPPGRYLWRLEFDFGAGRLRKFRAEFSLP